MFQLVLPIVVCVALVAAPPQATTKADPRERLDTALSHGITLLESKDYKSFLLQFVPPDEVKRRTESMGMDAWTEYFSKQAGSVLAAFRYATMQTPTYDEKKTTATFPLKETGGPKALTMIKIGPHWHLGNK